MVSRGEAGGWVGDGVAWLRHGARHGAQRHGGLLQGGGRTRQAVHCLVHVRLRGFLRPPLELAGDEELIRGHVVKIRNVVLILCGRRSSVCARAECVQSVQKKTRERARAGNPPLPPARPVSAHFVHRADRESGGEWERPRQQVKVKASSGLKKKEFGQRKKFFRPKVPAGSDARVVV